MARRYEMVRGMSPRINTAFVYIFAGHAPLYSVAYADLYSRVRRALEIVAAKAPSRFHAHKSHSC